MSISPVGPPPVGKICRRCEASVSPFVTVCPKCGMAFVLPPGEEVASGVSDLGSTTGTELASAWCYLMGPISGTITLVLHNNRVIRFHAYQSNLLGVAVVAVMVAAGVLLGLVNSVLQEMGPPLSWPPAPNVAGPKFVETYVLPTVGVLVSFSFLSISVYMIVTALMGKLVELPVIGRLAKRWALERAN